MDSEIKKVFQKTFHIEGVSKGDCLRACLETITEIQGLPHYTQIGPYDDILEYNGFSIDQDDLQYLEFAENMYKDVCIAVGESPRGVHHAVIIDKKGNLIHDPHPEGGGISEVKYCFIISKLK